MRPPKLLQPTPTTLTVRDPIVRVSTGHTSRRPVLRAGPGRQYCTGGHGDRADTRGGNDGSRGSGRDGDRRAGGRLEGGRRLRGRGGLLPRDRVVPSRGRR